MPYPLRNTVANRQGKNGGTDSRRLKMEGKKKPSAYTTPSSMQEGNQYLKFFHFFGISDLHQAAIGSIQYIGQCPFEDCKRADHLFVNSQTGQWDCKVCKRTGNQFSFMPQFLESCLAHTSDADYRRLAKEREGISPETFAKFKLAYNPLDGNWLFPSFTLAQHKVSNLYSWKYDETAKKKLVKSAPGLRHIPLGLQFFDPDKEGPIWIAEGHWDLLAWYEICQKLSVKSGEAKIPVIQLCNVIGTPGAGTFTREHIGMLNAKTVNAIFDNDDGGRDGIKSLKGALTKFGVMPTKFSQLVWPEQTEDGFDIRDMKASTDKLSNAYKFVNDNLEPIKIDPSGLMSEGFDPDITPEVCSSFADVIDCYKNDLHISENLEDVIAYSFAVVSSTKLSDIPLWGYLVGPSSSGKTTLLEPLMTAHPHTVARSKFTGLISGFQIPGSKKETSPITQFNRKCIIVKDWTMVLAMTAGDRERVYSELRDAFDGEQSAAYRNGKEVDFKGINFSILAAVTDEIRQHNQTGLGERFLMMEIDSDWSQSGHHQRMVDTSARATLAYSNILASICNVTDGPVTAGSGLIPQKIIAWGFLDHLAHLAKDPKTLKAVGEGLQRDVKFQEFITDIAQWTAWARGSIRTTKEDEAAFRSRSESGLRLIKQLTKLSMSLCLVYGVTKPDERLYRVIRRVALDTAMSFQLEIMLKLCHVYPRPMTREEIATACNIGTSATRRTLYQMAELRIVSTDDMIPNPSGIGRNRYVCRLSPEAIETAIRLGFISEVQRLETAPTVITRTNPNAPLSITVPRKIGNPGNSVGNNRGLRDAMTQLQRMAKTTKRTKDG